MKKNLIFQKNKLIFKSFSPKNVKLRLTYKFWFFKKYFRYSLPIQNFFLKYKKFFFFCNNLFRYSLYLNWTKFFSLKYYDIYLEDSRITQLKKIIPLKKIFNHVGDLQKPFFLKKKIPAGTSIFFLFSKNYAKVNQFFLKKNYLFLVKILYRINTLLTLIKIINS